jgi:hypothetical protein
MFKTCTLSKKLGDIVDPFCALLLGHVVVNFEMDWNKETMQKRQLQFKLFCFHFYIYFPFWVG